ncbi:Arm DNA-binding domain-containing protein, partial [Enterococcus cecorum]
MKLEKYDTKSGQRWRVFEYIGTNKDGKVVTIRKKGFKTKKEAKLYAEKQIELYKHDKNNYLTQKNPINNEVTFKEVYK